MNGILVRIKLPDVGRTREMTLPTNWEVGDFLPELANRLGLPLAQNGCRLHYLLHQERTDYTFKQSEKLASTVKPNDILNILIAVD